MKEIRIPKELTVRFNLDGGSERKDYSANSFSNDLSIIEKNGAELIAAAVLLESRMIEAVTKLLFGANAEKNSQREFFSEEIMGSSDFSFAFKRRVFTRLLEHTKALGPDEIKGLKAGLNKIMEWRNAFAHGKLLHEHYGGFALLYYSGGAKEFTLDDAFFEQVESTIRSCLYECNGVIQAK